MNWDVIWLVAGGIALGDALSSTKLASVLAHTVDNVDTNAFTIICLLCFIAWLASNFISNTATANLMLPISVAVLFILKPFHKFTLTIISKGRKYKYFLDPELS